VTCHVGIVLKPYPSKASFCKRPVARWLLTVRISKERLPLLLVSTRFLSPKTLTFDGKISLPTTFHRSGFYVRDSLQPVQFHDVAGVFSRSQHNMGSKINTFDPLTADVRFLQNLLSNGNITSESLIDVYLGQVRKHDGYLHAMIETTPRGLLLQRAHELDRERQAGTVRGPLHGIPVIIKVTHSSNFLCRTNSDQDNIATHPSLGLGTRAGSLALVGSKPRKNAVIVDMVRLIIYSTQGDLEF
jgi:hypothetical protein